MVQLIQPVRLTDESKVLRLSAILRPDFSNYVVHFTKDRRPNGLSKHGDDLVLKSIEGTSALDRLVNILATELIHATPMPWTDASAVAFTECPWGSLLDHAKAYSPYGVGFEKARLYAAGGAPALYLRQDLYKKQMAQAKGFDPSVWPFVTPFVPSYAPKKHLEDWKGSPIDYTHEREWRVPHGFTFKLKQVTFVVVKTYEDVARFPKELKDAIGRDRFLIMDVYEQIERFWPTHLTKR